MILPVIMAGGSGTRLFPLSRKAFPKQFLRLNGDQSLLQQSIARLDGLDHDRLIVICNEEHRFLTAGQLQEIGIEADILLEPVGKNTAPAIALAALHAMKSTPQEPPLLLILSADHSIAEVQAFTKAVKNLVPEVAGGKFGTLGVVPTCPATGYGYIESEPSDQVVAKVKSFHEKPNQQMAEKYLSNQNYLWNSGIFLIRADQYLEKLKEYRTDIYDSCKEAVEKATTDLDFVRVDNDSFAKCASESIDYALLEPLSHKGEIVVAPLDANWSDIGSFESLWEISPKDESGNASNDMSNTLIRDSSGCFVYTKDKLVALLGVENLAVIDTPDALLVADKSKSQEIKKIVETLEKQKRSEHINHKEVYRPWGKYDSIDLGTRHQVKKITVSVGAKLSLQKHHHRAEHWIVVNGTAKVTIENEEFLLTENQSTYIPIGKLHRLENVGQIPLEMIEVQSGSYLGEDDIVRVDDTYGRC